LLSKRLACAVLDTGGIQETNVKERTDFKKRKSFTNGRKIAKEEGMKTDISRPDPHSFCPQIRQFRKKYFHLNKFSKKKRSFSST